MTDTAETPLARALASNKRWAAAAVKSDPELFQRLAAGQAPTLLWLGCSDSRVPETTITGLGPGEIFVHRNIANVIAATDLSARSVIDYAVGAVGVQQVIVCGHEGCGGVAAALSDKRLGPIDAWLAALREVRARIHGELDALEPGQRATRLVEENVREGVRRVRDNPNVIAAAGERGLTVHGLVYSVRTGELREIDCGDDEGAVKAREACHTAT